LAIDQSTIRYRCLKYGGIYETYTYADIKLTASKPEIDHPIEWIKFNAVKLIRTDSGNLIFVFQNSQQYESDLSIPIYIIVMKHDANIDYLVKYLMKRLNQNAMAFNCHICHTFLENVCHAHFKTDAISCDISAYCQSCRGPDTKQCMSCNYFYTSGTRCVVDKCVVKQMPAITSPYSICPIRFTVTGGNSCVIS
jgi:hypothetical protein